MNNNNDRTNMNINNEKKRRSPPVLSRNRSRSLSPNDRTVHHQTEHKILINNNININNNKRRTSEINMTVTPRPHYRRKAKHRVMQRWCSWCLQLMRHTRIQKNYVRRSVYHCSSCLRRTLPCRFCDEGMSRGHYDYDDELCAKCDGTIIEWTNETKSERLLKCGFCSWCFIMTNMNLHMANIVRRDVYRCEHCDGLSAVCLKCDHAFTRCSEFYDDKLCYVCDGTLNTWINAKDEAKKNGLDILKKIDSNTSFSPPRNNIYCKALIDGQDFFEELSNALDNAKNTIFMAFWQVNHKIYLKRDKNNFIENYRFDNIIKRKAEDGVKIYMILWRENHTYFGPNNFSAEMKEYFSNLHENIQVIRHGHPTPLQNHWCHHQKFIVIDENIAFVGGLDVCLGRWDNYKHKLIDENIELWPGIDYYNPHKIRPPTIDTFFSDVINRKIVPRMPWHDVSILCTGQAAYDAGRNFIQRWNHHKENVYALHTELDALTISDIDKLPSTNYNKGTCVVQMIRSLDLWSGASRIETSIYGTYLQAIDSAEYYIYIENQYFVSSTAGSGVQNQVSYHILQKLRQKIRNQEKFRVIIVITQPEEQGDAALSILRYQYLTINRGGASILEQLSSEFPDVNLDEYVGFFFLRQIGYFNDGLPTTEKVFIHSKLMIVDDKVALIASANLNDRSFLGDRDSELGAVVIDEDKIISQMNHIEVEVGRFPHELRVKLWSEHLGLSMNNSDTNNLLLDPICDQVYNDLWLKTAKRNTYVLQKVFPGIPSNKYRRFQSYVDAGGLNVPVKPNLDIQAHLLKDVQGTLTLHPIDFLIDDPWQPPIKNHILGNYLYQ